MTTKLNVRVLVLFLIVVGAIALSLFRTRPPAVVPADAPQTDFSAERAILHVAPISQEPHMTGTPEIYKVRDYILGELAEIGLEAELQRTLEQNPLRNDEVALAENILGRIPGTKPSGAIVFIGHYDSPPHSPGAGDDGAAVAVMLETARTVATGPPLANDVIFLFSDAEESTIGGAFAAHTHPWMDNAALVVNLEMRGTSGPVYMFETGPENGRVIPEFAKAVPYPATSSLMRDVYSNMPNNTDFTAYRDARYAGFNISVLEGSTHYHAPTDTVDKLDPRSLQHHGSYTLGIARHFGDIDLGNLKADDAVYFDLLGSTLIHYPGFLSIPLMIVTLLLFVALVIYGMRRGKLTLKGIGQGFLAFLVVIVAGPGFVTLLWFIVRAVANPPMVSGDTDNSLFYFLAFCLLIVAITAALYRWFGRRVSVSNLYAGTLLWWAVMMLGITFVFPKANFLFLWPMLFALIGLRQWFSMNEGNRLEWSDVAILLVAVLPGLLIVPATMLSVFMGLLALVSITGASLVLLSLLLSLLVPHMALMGRLFESERGWGQRWLPVGSAVLGIAVVLFAIVTTRVDVDHPRLFQLIYAYDMESAEAVWASVEGSEYDTEWTEQFFTERARNGPLPQFFGGERPQFRIEQAPVASLSLPEIAMVEHEQEGNMHRVRLSIASTAGANQARFYIEPPAEVLSVALNGEPLAVDENPPDREEMWSLAYVGPLTEALELSMEIRSAQPVVMRVVEVARGVPEIVEQVASPLPDYLVPFSCFCRDDSMMTYVSSLVTIE